MTESQSLLALTLSLKLPDGFFKQYVFGEVRGRVLYFYSPVSPREAICLRQIVEEDLRGEAEAYAIKCKVAEFYCLPKRVVDELEVEVVKDAIVIYAPRDLAHVLRKNVRSLERELGRRVRVRR